MSDTKQGSGPNFSSAVKVCDCVQELEQALSFVCEDCRLTNPVEVSYQMRNGEGFMRVEPSAMHMLHRLWTMCVGMDGYDKDAWRAIESQLGLFGTIPAKIEPSTARKDSDK